MYYTKLGVSIPDATCVVGGHVTMYFNPKVQSNQSMGRVAQCWYSDDEGAAYEEAFEEMDIDQECLTVSLPIAWVDYTILPAMGDGS